MSWRRRSPALVAMSTLGNPVIAPELSLPSGLSEAEALQMLESGAEGRFDLEFRLKYTVCTIGGCLLPTGHVGMCRAPQYGSGRKKTARKVFEIDDDAPQHVVNPKRIKGGRKGPKAADAASVAHAGSPEAPFQQSFASSHTPLDELTRTIELVPNMRAAPSFLDANAQAHPNPFSPIADLLDNGIEAGASEMRVGLHKLRGVSMLTMTDNGRGMTERSLLDGPLSLCYTKKGGTHYGMGATTSIPAIGGFCLIFSVGTNGQRTVGFLSSKLSAQVKARGVQWKMPAALLEEREPPITRDRFPRLRPLSLPPERSLSR